MIRSAIGFSVLIVAVVSLLVAFVASAGQDAVASKRSQFMRMKLDQSKNALEGLTREDYALIGKSARTLKRLSEAAEWEDPMIPNVEQYLAYTNEFQRLCDEMGTKAKEKKVDGPTLAYLKLTMNCVSCHKFVRTVRD